MKKPLIVVMFLLFSSSAWAVPIVLDFEGLGSAELIGGFYNGGTGGSGSGSGINYGITFSSSAEALIDITAGGTIDIEGEPSSHTVLDFNPGEMFITVNGGFDTGFSFYYSAIIQSGSVSVYDGLDGNGNILATLSMPQTPSTNGAWDFVPIGVSFSGTAKSVGFDAAEGNPWLFDNITFGTSFPSPSSGSPAPVPEPSTLVLMGSGLAGLFYFKRKFERKM